MKQQYIIILTLGLGVIGIAAVFGIFGFFTEKLTARIEKLATSAYSDLSDQPVPLYINYSTGQKIYVPAYSYIPLNENVNFNFNILLSIRNTDPSHIISISRVDYYDTQGALKKQFIEEAQNLNPLETKEFFIEQVDPLGGSGANFFITWESDSTCYEPVVEALMYGIRGTHSFEFKSQGLIITDK